MLWLSGAAVFEEHGQVTELQEKRLRELSGRLQVAKLFPSRRPLNDIVSLMMSVKQTITIVFVFQDKDTQESFFCLKAPITEKDRILKPRHPIKPFIE